VTGRAAALDGVGGRVQPDDVEGEDAEEEKGETDGEAEHRSDLGAGADVAQVAGGQAEGDDQGDRGPHGHGSEPDERHERHGGDGRHGVAPQRRAVGPQRPTVDDDGSAQHRAGHVRRPSRTRSTT
jgi:hypothetical protein